MSKSFFSQLSPQIDYIKHSLWYNIVFLDPRKHVASCCLRFGSPLQIISNRMYLNLAETIHIARSNVTHLIPIRILTHSLHHSLFITHSSLILTHSLLLTHSLPYTLTQPFTHSLTHSLIHSLTHSLTHSLNHSLIHSLTHLFSLSKSVSCTHLHFVSFIHVLPFSHSVNIHSFIHFLYLFLLSFYLSFHFFLFKVCLLNSTTLG